MDKVFAADLDSALEYLYKCQYTHEEASEQGKRELAAQGADMRSDVYAMSEHFTCVTPSELETHALFRIDITEREKFFAGKFILQQLSADGYVQRTPDKTDGTHLHITHTGVLFHEEGGYRGRLRLARREWLMDRAKTGANVINAAAVILLTWWAAQSAAADKVQDETIIKLGKQINVLEQRNVDLEHEILLERKRSNEAVTPASQTDGTGAN